MENQEKQNRIRVTCTGAGTAEISDLVPFQGELKSLSEKSYQKLRASILKYGVSFPFFVWKHDDKLHTLDGHQRDRVLRKMRDDEDFVIPPVPVDFIGAADEKEAKEKILILSSQFGKIDNDSLYGFVMENELDFEELKTVIDLPEINLEKFEEGWIRDGGGGTTEDEAPEPSVEAISKLGDLYELENHRLLCQDSTIPQNVERLMNGQKSVLMATDPPYGDSWIQKAKDMQAHGYVHSRAVLHGSIMGDDKSETELKEFLLKFLAAARCAGHPPFPIYVWHRAKRMIFEQALIDAGYLVHQPVIWVKPSFVIGRLHYHPRCEWALHGWLQGSGACPFYGERNQSDVWEIARENEKIHPTQKPLELFAIPMRNHTKKEEICYDPFLGSGTTLIAAEQLGRKVFGIEIEPRYVDVTITRYLNLRPDAKILRNGEQIDWPALVAERDRKIAESPPAEPPKPAETP